MASACSRKWRRRSGWRSATTGECGAISSSPTSALTPADFDEVTLTAPSNPALPNGGGYPVTFLTRNTRSALGATDSYYTTTDDYGDETHYWHGFDLSFNARTRWGLVVQGGTSTGRGVNDTCDTLNARFGRTMTPTIGTPAARASLTVRPAATPRNPGSPAYAGSAPTRCRRWTSSSAPSSVRSTRAARAHRLGDGAARVDRKWDANGGGLAGHPARPRSPERRDRSSAPTGGPASVCSSRGNVRAAQEPADVAPCMGAAPYSLARHAAARPVRRAGLEERRPAADSQPGRARALADQPWLCVRWGARGVISTRRDGVLPFPLRGVRLPVLEAMLMGTPVLASDIPVHREVAGTAAVLLPPDDPTRWATEAAALASDDDRRRELAARGRSRASEFSWRRAATDTAAAWAAAARIRPA